MTARAYNPRLAHGRGGRTVSRIARAIAEAEAARERWERLRDTPHAMLLVNGLCRFCWGYVDDPRHTVYLYAGSAPAGYGAVPASHIRYDPHSDRRRRSGVRSEPRPTIDQIHAQSIFKRDLPGNPGLARS